MWLKLTLFHFDNWILQKKKLHQQNQDIYSENKISSIFIHPPDFNKLLCIGDPVGIKFPHIELSNDF